MSVHLLPGKRDSSKIIYDGEGYYYYVNKVRNNTAYMICVNKNCKGRCKSAEPLEEGVVMTITKPHCHSANSNYGEIMALKRKIFARSEHASNSNTCTLKSIFEDECAKVPIDVSKHVGYGEIESTMRKRRRSTQPATPGSLTEYGQMLQNDQGRFSTTLNGKQFFHRTIISAEGTSVVFASPNLLQEVNNTRELHIDGTFKVIPRAPRFRQLLTVMSVHYDHAFPVVSILMEKKTERSYVDVLECCKDLLSQLSETIIITDFESGLQNAIRRVFDGFPILGCWFHYASAIFKKARKLGLYRQRLKYNEVRTAIKLTMCLPLLPADRIQEGFDYVLAYGIDNEISRLLAGFTKYVKRHWISGVGVATLSVFDQISRTNNFQEAYHRNLKRAMGLHPPIWEFTDYLRKQENNAVRDFATLKAGKQITRSTKKEYLLQDKRIKNASNKLKTSRWQVSEFLNACSITVDEYEQRMLATPQVGEISESEFDEGTESEENEGPESETEEAEEVAGAEGGESEEVGEAEVGDAEVGEAEGNYDSDIEVIDLTAPNEPETVPAATRDINADVYNDLVENPLNIVNIIEGNNQVPLPPPQPYKLYRVKPTVLIENVFMDEEEVQIQQEELLLSLSLGDEPSFEVQEEDEVVCTLCMVNSPTRICTPCGHAIVCRPCLPVFVGQKRYYSVTRADGSIYETPFRLPIICPTCRSIVGQLILTY